MRDALKSLEERIEMSSRRSELTVDTLQRFPEEFRQLHSYKIFGVDLLAIPGELFDDEFERPFSFVGDLEAIEIFESEFRPEIPDNFIQIGSLYGATEIVLLDKQKHTIHIFHVSDVVDKKWLNQKLESAVCDFKTLIEKIRPQTVCCLMDPKNYSKWDIFEIRNGKELKEGGKITTYPDRETAWLEYRKLVEMSLRKGYQIHYAPKALKEELGK